jgi:GT2 family glycosyltransferase
VALRPAGPKDSQLGADVELSPLYWLIVVSLTRRSVPGIVDAEYECVSSCLGKSPSSHDPWGIERCATDGSRWRAREEWRTDASRTVPADFGWTVMSDHPLISIVILTYNNFPILRQCIHSALALDYPEYEILVVDNASTDNTAAMVKEEFGDRVHLIVCQQNSPVAARNQGFWHSRGEFVLSLDHDMIFFDRQLLRRAVEFFREFPRVGLLGVKICGQHSPNEPLGEHWWYPTPMEKGKDRHFFTSYFAEGAAFFRSEALRESGGYDESFHHFAENLDLSFRLIDLGWKILYCPSLSSVELVVSKHVSRRRTQGNYYSLRNRLWLARKHYPMLRVFTYSISRILMAGARSIRYGWFDYFLAGLRDGVFAPEPIRRARRPLRSDRWAEMRRIEGVSVSPPVACNPTGSADRN